MSLDAACVEDDVFVYSGVSLFETRSEFRRGNGKSMADYVLDNLSRYEGCRGKTFIVYRNHRGNIVEKCTGNCPRFKEIADDVRSLSECRVVRIPFLNKTMDELYDSCCA